ncbi:MAG: 2-oxoacid:acceptor oxidoreductase family protein [Acholeplasmataceae bacterium]|nr:2-oxoacid:acceptor oxidoreductase family protein [Acholeplasmataceae bacterium]
MIRRIRIAGFGGQGVMLTGQLLAYAANEQGLYSVWVPTYGPETRGGTANCAVTISDKPIYSPIFKKADDLLVFNLPSLHKFQEQITSDGNIFYNSSLIEEEVKQPFHLYGVPMNQIANELGTPQVANMVMFGAYLKVSNIFKDDIIQKSLKYFLKGSKETLLPVNQKAIAIGYDYV